ncbi:hypothetical protein VTL71DRAFT_1111 [Oculimacula yallundae]|uniref:AAA+ ATPase domain-containing protein n=1 Tax=Oculimacula yallundae TaxID=86028 RepID=A0ABR4D1X9_9HELO
MSPQTTQKSSRRRRRNAHKLRTASKKIRKPVPEWFLRNCVRSVEELLSQKSLVVTENSAVAPVEDTVDDKASDQSISDKYEIPEVLYRSLKNVVSPLPPTDLRGWTDHTDDKNMYFTNDFVRLNFPTGPRIQHKSQSFFTAVVEHFARDIGSDVVSLTFNRVAKLAAYYSIAENQCTLGNLPFDRILKSPVSKSKRRGKSSRPLIVHIPEVFDYSRSKITREASQCIQNAIQKLDQNKGRILVIGTDREGSCMHFDWPQTDWHRDENNHCHDCSMDFFPLRFGRNPRSLPDLMIPTPSAGQMLLLEKDEKLCIEGKNILGLQTVFKQRPFIDQNSAGMLPNAKWKFKNRLTSEILQKSVFDASRLEVISQAISNEGDIRYSDIEYAILETEVLPKAIKEWTTSANQTSTGKWAKASTQIRKVVGILQANTHRYEKEILLLDSIIDPTEITETWTDIELDGEVKTTASQMVDLNLYHSKSAYGLLKDNRIDGMLLYGPPGTGKTQLARVMARESKAVMMHISPADMITKWVGDTEKFIKAFFNLAKMLSPCMIFIDEADSLFRARSSSDMSWERNQTNQLLLEVDGLRKESSRPFLVLATNHPQYLDPAVLRRVPSRLYIGFPFENARANILKMYLKEEQLHADVDIRSLAGKTRRYTGSDLRYVCIRAAQLCEAEILASNEPGAKRVLGTNHFEGALRNIAPSVSEETIGDLRVFARKFDTDALLRICLEPVGTQTGQSIQMNSSRTRGATKREPRTNPFLEEQQIAKRQMLSPATAREKVDAMMKKLPFSTPFYVP